MKIARWSFALLLAAAMTLAVAPGVAQLIVTSWDWR